MDIEDQVVRKDWSSPIEMWVFRQIEKGSKAHTLVTRFGDKPLFFRDFLNAM
jgi:hypothetical protein